MFGPNIKSDKRDVYYHHRECQFHTILSILRDSFSGHFGLNEYDLLFVTGNGTIVNEIIMCSCNRAGFNILFDDADFGSRLGNMAAYHSEDTETTSIPITAYPLYETSISRLNLHERKTGEPLFLDMVSAFPYYMPPKGTEIWTTVSSKQLGSYPVLGIIAIHKNFDLGAYVRNCNGSYLNLLEHRQYQQKCETMATPAIPLYYDLLQTLRKFDRVALVEKIDRRRKRIRHIVGVDNMLGIGPVVTLKNTEQLKPVAEKFNLYQTKAGYQIFLWSGNNNDYNELYKELERMIK